MNRRKKINQTLKGKAKKANAKKAGSNKPKYVSKAERALEQQIVISDDNQTQPIEAVVATEQVG
ncbi:DUF2986 domain-containing protein [Shewanella olleyana]|uniref:DUF2986 domain-containing protein n=1 Tax=Shewanella olleyana TaxID=135626 RepID=UPI00200E1BD4|nr:DUF2986 domain-containing protein [Shewanella olleyana]MCL1067760.1 DUF2986 domain-containing protein [Shewanella olleyana]